MLLKYLTKKILFFLILISTLAILVVNLYVKKEGNNHIVPLNKINKTQVAIVFGAYVSPEGILCDMLEDRVLTAVELYKDGKVNKILMTGDHGSTSYDEVNHMRKFAEGQGIPTEDIFMDHAGFNTYDSMYRARDVFRVNSAVLVTQEFHLPRAVYIARSMGINAKGVIADKQIYIDAYPYEFREMLARNKDFINLKVLKPKPKFLGPAISINGDGRLTHD